MKSTSQKTVATFIFIVILTIIAAVIALPKSMPVAFSLLGRNINTTISSPTIDFNFFGRRIYREFELKQGLDIQGGIQVVLEADMSEINQLDRQAALESARDIILRRVDLYGINEPLVQTSIAGDQYRLIVELAGVQDPNQALQLIGTTAQLSFRLQNQDINDPAIATQSALLFFEGFEKTSLTGADLRRSTVQFDQTTGQPVISLEFTPEGASSFADITTENVGSVLAIFIDEMPVTLPVIQTPITTGQAQISGDFTVEEANQLAIQLNAGALPVPIEILEQRTIGASLGQESVNASVRAGLIGLGLVMLFMTLYYRMKGFLASLALVVYSILTVAVYKIIGVTLTLPGIAGLLLSIGMAVDANILIFERMKEELRLGKSFNRAMELGFGRAWDSIKDANLATIATALVLINPLNLTFLNTSGLVRGFGITLLIGVLISLFTGVVVTRTLMRLFLSSPDKKGAR